MGEHQPNMQSSVGEHHPCSTPSIYIALQKPLILPDEVVHVIYVTWAGVICLICMHELEGEHGHISKSQSHMLHNYVCYVIPLGL